MIPGGRDEQSRKEQRHDEQNAEMRAINERLVIAGVRQHEHAHKAEEAERQTAEALERIRAAMRACMRRASTSNRSMPRSRPPTKRSRPPTSGSTTSPKRSSGL